MRFIAAIVSFVLAFGMIAFGIAQRTVLLEPANVTSTVTSHSDATVTLVDSATLQSIPGRQKLDIAGTGSVFAAYGRTEDVQAWVGNTKYNKLTYDKTKGKLVSTVVPGKATKVPDPIGSDLWLDEFSHSKSLSFTVNVPNDITVIIVSNGTKPAPANVSITWPLDNRTPWAGPLIVGGILLLIVGAVLYFWALRHLRRSRGPRRKTPKMPKVPKQRSPRNVKQRPSGQKAVPSGRRAARPFLAIPLILISTLALSGCASDLWPEFMGGAKGSTAVPVATSTPVVPGQDLQVPAVTAPQLKNIVAQISAVATKADTDKDTTLVATRFEGAALALRVANYGIRKADNTYAALPAIPAGTVALTLPQQSNSWPRTVFTVVQNPTDKTVPPIAMMLVQDTPRDNYKVDYAVALEAKAKLPDVAPANIGAPRLPPDSKLQLLAPAKLALSYGDIIANGTTSDQAKYFDLTKDNLIGLIGSAYRKAQIAALPSTATMSFANSNGAGQVIALGSNDSGAIVAVELNETVTVTPTEAGAAVNPEGAVKSLSGITGSTKGTVAVYGDQLLFYVPKASSKSKITLLGFATGLISATEKP
ncbi:MAG: hypothetical protein JWN80_491 [Microbacteriaceae bacterium]|nr:hypothetical protein [Microbacteriaceae bacterium]